LWKFEPKTESTFNVQLQNREARFTQSSAIILMTKAPVKNLIHIY